MFVTGEEGDGRQEQGWKEKFSSCVCRDMHMKRFRMAAPSWGGGLGDGSVCVRQGHRQGSKAMAWRRWLQEGRGEGYNWYQMPSEANDLTNAVLIKQIL